MTAQEYQAGMEKFFPVTGEARVERALLIARSLIRAGRVDASRQKSLLEAARETPWLLEATFSRLDLGDPLRLQLEQAGVQLLPTEITRAQTEEITLGSRTAGPLAVQAKAKSDVVLVRGRECGIVGNLF